MMLRMEIYFPLFRFVETMMFLVWVNLLITSNTVVFLTEEDGIFLFYQFQFIMDERYQLILKK